MLPKKKQCRGKRISLYAAFRLATSRSWRRRANFFPHTFLLSTRSVCWSPETKAKLRGMSGHAASKMREGRWCGEKVTEERRISVKGGSGDCIMLRHIRIGPQRDAESRHQGVHRGTRAKGQGRAGR